METVVDTKVNLAEQIISYVRSQLNRSDWRFNVVDHFIKLGYDRGQVQRCITRSLKIRLMIQSSPDGRNNVLHA